MENFSHYSEDNIPKTGDQVSTVNNHRILRDAEHVHYCLCEFLRLPVELCHERGDKEIHALSAHIGDYFRFLCEWTSRSDETRRTIKSTLDGALGRVRGKEGIGHLNGRSTKSSRRLTDRE